MTPFQQFRLWARRASVTERASAVIGAVVAFSLLVWAFIPAGSSSTGGQQVNSLGNASAAGPGGNGSGTGQGGPIQAGGAGSGAASGTPTTGGGTGAIGSSGGGTAGPSGTNPAGGTTATSVGGGSGGTAGGSGGTTAPTPATSGGCVSPPGSDQGVTASEIKIAIIIVSIIGPAGNDTFGVPSVQEQTLDYQQVIDAINASGGVACRKLVAQFVTANPANDSDRQQKCLDIIQAKPFFVVDAGGYYGTPISNCFPQHQLPFMSTGRLTIAQRNQFYPYMFSTGNLEELYHNMVFGLKTRGFFDPAKGFKKLGFLYRSCFTEVNSEFSGWLQQAGVPSSQIVTYDFGCPQSFSSPSDIQAAILKFEQAGVTNVTESQFFTDFANFTKVAQQQGFKPKYGIADDGIVPITGGNLSPDHNNLDTAIAITGDRYGEESTPGLSPTAATQKCDAIYRAKGRPPVWRQPVGFGGVTCDQLWVLQAAIDHAPSLQRTSLASGLHIAKTVDLSFPRGPADFTGQNVTYGGQFWRPEQFLNSCGCWRILDPTFKPSFP